MHSHKFLACRYDMSSCFKFLQIWLPNWVELYRELGAKSALNLLCSLGPSTLSQCQGKQLRQRWLPCCVSGKGEICDLQSHSHGLLVSSDLKSFAKNQMCYRESNEAMLSFHNGLSSLPPPTPLPNISWSPSHPPEISAVLTLKELSAHISRAHTLCFCRDLDRLGDNDRMRSSGQVWFSKLFILNSWENHSVC